MNKGNDESFEEGDVDPEENISWEEEKTFQSVEEVYAASWDKEKPFRSRFKNWIRTAALAVLIAFIPEQASWAFNYNPLVLWGNKVRATGQSPLQQTVQSDASQAEIISARSPKALATCLINSPIKLTPYLTSNFRMALASVPRILTIVFN